jgi:hypothetical protein
LVIAHRQQIIALAARCRCVVHPGVA